MIGPDPDAPRGLRAELLFTAAAQMGFAMRCGAFWRCDGCGIVAGGPEGMTMMRCYCGGGAFTAATRGDFLAAAANPN